MTRTDQNERHEVEVVITQPSAAGETRKRHLKLYRAAVNGDWEIAKSIFEKYLIELLVTLINNYLYDAALLLVNNNRQLATLRAGNKETALHALARMPLTSSEVANPNQQGFLKSLFNLFSGTNMVHNRRMNPKALKLVEILWEEVILLDDYPISVLIGLPWKLIFVAAEHGNDQFLSKLIDKYPDLIFKVNEHQLSIFHIAVLNRHEKIFNLIYETGSIKDLIVVKEDEEKNIILHLAAKLPPPNRLNIVSGAALQLQRELLWFKEVKKVVQPLYTEAKNENGKTPRALFTEQHRELMGKGEEWMKNTAQSYLLIVFAAAFTIPGGVKEDTGSPNFLRKVSFIIFSISDPVSLVYFLWSLPTKLILGISTLFLSIAAMMGMQELAILATALASIPVFLFLWQQHHFLLDVIRSTYISNSLFHHRKQTRILEEKSNPSEESY
ncbi:hypothetical protein ACOSQ3_013408 [Xanthoceras sorbifolium]